MPLQVENKKWNTGIEKLRDALYCIFFFFMPFTQALTFDVGFPLKISELALVALSFLYIFFNKQIKIPRPILLCITGLLLIGLASTIVNIFWEYPYSLRTYPARFGYTIDSIARFIYFVFAILSFLISLDIFLTDKNKYITIWIYGAIAAAAYSWYLMLFSWLKLPVFLLPGMQSPPQTIGPGLIRCGTFLEGNYMGLFLVVSAAMSFYIGKYKACFFLLVSVITTFAMLSMFSAIVLGFIYSRPFLFNKKYRIVVICAALLSIPVLVPFARSNFFKIYVYEKIFSNTDSIGYENNGAFSKTDRIVTLKTAVKTAVANPVLGVGPSNFGRHYEHFYERGNLDERMYHTLLRKNAKVIPNNIYTEIWSETGTIALLVFIIFLTFLLKYAKTDRSNALFTALICMIICFNAYPSFIMIYLWSFMALPVAHFMQGQHHNQWNKK